jgi:hypothetical protein
MTLLLFQTMYPPSLCNSICSSTHQFWIKGKADREIVSYVPKIALTLLSAIVANDICGGLAERPFSVNSFTFSAVMVEKNREKCPANKTAGNVAKAPPLTLF